MIHRQRRRRIFVSYRRDDATWFAGRLADALTAYFGNRRVFRDVEGIEGGADFVATLRDTLDSSDAVIVVIGPGWLNARDAQGRRRLELDDDWVVQEVGTALARGVPIYPVLVGETPMPRREELPPALAPLARLHAVSLSDARWDDDVHRFGRIVSLDIPPAAERRLQAVNFAVSLALVTTLLFTFFVLVRALLLGVPAPPQGVGLLGTVGDHLSEGCGGTSDPATGPLRNWHAAPVFLAASCGAALMFAFARHVAAASRSAYLAAAWVGGAGTFVAFFLYFFACPAYEPLLVMLGALVVAPVMLALMSLSGFRSR